MVLKGTRIAIGALVVSGLFIGCAYDWSFPGGVPADPDGGGGTDSSKDNTTSESSSPPDVFTPDAPLPPGECRKSTDCSAKEYCNFDDDQCGRTSGNGKCAAMIDLAPCPDSHEVCGCSGAKQPNACAATQKGDDLNLDPTACGDGVAQGLFRCGALYCKTSAEFCVFVKSKNSYRCEAASSCTAPFKCSNPCNEIDAYKGSCSCAGGPSYEVTLTCP